MVNLGCTIIKPVWLLIIMDLISLSSIGTQLCLWDPPGLHRPPAVPQAQSDTWHHLPLASSVPGIHLLPQMPGLRCYSMSTSSFLCESHADFVACFSHYEIGGMSWPQEAHIHCTVSLALVLWSLVRPCMHSLALSFFRATVLSLFRHKSRVTIDVHCWCLFSQSSWSLAFTYIVSQLFTVGGQVQWRGYTINESKSC